MYSGTLWTESRVFFTSAWLTRVTVCGGGYRRLPPRTVTEAAAASQRREASHGSRESGRGGELEPPPGASSLGLLWDGVLLRRPGVCGQPT
jgi:hypothetical protein